MPRIEIRLFKYIVRGILFSLKWVNKHDYKNKYLVTGDWSQSNLSSAKGFTALFFFFFFFKKTDNFYAYESFPFENEGYSERQTKKTNIYIYMQVSRDLFMYLQQQT